MIPTPKGRPRHDDVGLQPERTTLAWSRTALSMLVAASTFLRWLPHHGWFVETLVAAALITSVALHFTHEHRFHRAVHGINEKQATLDIASTLTLAASVVLLSILGIYTVLFLPLKP